LKQLVVKKDRSHFVNKTDLMKILPQVYQTCFPSQLSAAQCLTLEILVWLFQAHKQVILAIDRTQWRDKNLFMVSVIWSKRAIPLYWKLLDKRGSSNLREQKALLYPVLRLLKGYYVIVLGDREFRSVRLAQWLDAQGVYFALRQKESTYIQQPGQDYQRLDSLGFAPGIKMFLTGVFLTKQKGFRPFNLAAYWKRKYRGAVANEGWYILTNLESLSAALKAYQARSGIEAMFKDCKTGGYNLEGCHACESRLMSLVLIIALATHSNSHLAWLLTGGHPVRRAGLAKMLTIRGFQSYKTRPT
jgi:hypothetical protein